METESQRSDEPWRLGCVHGQNLERKCGNQPASQLKLDRAVWKLTPGIRLFSISELQESIVIVSIHGKLLSRLMQGLSLQGRWPQARGSQLS